MVAVMDADPPSPVAPLAPLVRSAFDYSDLTAAIAAVDDAIRRTRRQLHVPRPAPVEAVPDAEEPAELLWPDPADDDDAEA